MHTQAKEWHTILVGKSRCIVEGNVGARGNPLLSTPNLFKYRPTLPTLPHIAPLLHSNISANQRRGWVRKADKRLKRGPRSTHRAGVVPIVFIFGLVAYDPAPCHQRPYHILAQSRFCICYRAFWRDKCNAREVASNADCAA